MWNWVPINYDFTEDRDEERLLPNDMSNLDVGTTGRNAKIPSRMLGNE
jgi:hypothetical protein